MSQYSQLMGSYIRTGNFPLEADYVFKTEEALKEYYSDDLSQTLLHEGWLKVVLDDGDGKQALYWVTNEDGTYQFTKLISNNNMADALQQLSDISDALEAEIQARKDNDASIIGTDDMSSFPEGLGNLYQIAWALYNTDSIDFLETLKDVVGTDDNNISDYLTSLPYQSLTEVANALDSFLEGNESLSVVIDTVLSKIYGDPVPSDDFITLRNIENFVRTYIQTLQTTDAQLTDEINTTQTGVGLNADGSYSADQETYYLQNATSVMNALKTLDAKVHEALANISIEVENDDVVDLSITDGADSTIISASLALSDEGQLIKRNDGLYYKMDTAYSDGILTVYVNGNIIEQHNIGLSAIVESATYDSTNEQIVIVFKLQSGDTQTINIPVGAIIREWDVDNSQGTAVQLTKTVSISGTDMLSADVNISTEKHNILEKKDGTLYVDGTSDSITYNDTSLTKTLDDIIDGNDSTTASIQDLTSEISSLSDKVTANITDISKLQEAMDGKIDSIQLQQTSDLQYTIFVDGEILGTIDIPEDKFLQSVELVDDYTLQFTFTTTTGLVVKSVNVASVLEDIFETLKSDIDQKADINSPQFTGTPTIATSPDANDSSDRIPTTSWVNQAIESAVDSVASSITEYSAGDGISIVNGVISCTIDLSDANVDLSGYYTSSQVDSLISKVESDISGKQDTLSAGANITISNNTISATDTTYTAGTGISISNTNVISCTVDLSDANVDLSNYYTKDAIDSKISTLESTISSKQDALVAGDNITITGNVISAASADMSGYVTTSEVESLLSGKQDTLTAGTGIQITNGVISCTVDLSDANVDLSGYYTSSAVDALLASKQNTLSAGDNISIINNVISAVDTTYTAGTGIAISNQNVISCTADTGSVDLSGYYTSSQVDSLLKSKQDTLTAGTGISISSSGVVSCTVDLDNVDVDLSGYYTSSEVDSLLSDKQDTLKAGSNITISNNTISAVDTTYSAGSNIKISGTTISADLSNYYTYSEVDNLLAKKQDTLTAGTGIKIASGVISCTVDVSTDDLDLSGYYTSSDVDNLLANKQDSLTAGDNITIKNGVISATDTTYTAGSNITINNGVISATDTNTTYTAGTNVSISSSNVISATDTTYSVSSPLTMSGTTIGIDLSAYETVSDVTTALSKKQDTLTAGTNVSISSSNVISATDTTYTVSSPLKMSGTTISIDLSDYETVSAATTALAAKQDKLTAGTNITISGSTISATDTTYSAGSNVSISSSNVISVDLSNYATTSTVNSLKTSLDNLEDQVSSMVDQHITSGYIYESVSTPAPSPEDGAAQASIGTVTIEDNVIYIDISKYLVKTVTVTDSAGEITGTGSLSSGNLSITLDSSNVASSGIVYETGATPLDPDGDYNDNKIGTVSVTDGCMYIDITKGLVIEGGVIDDSGLITGTVTNSNNELTINLDSSAISSAISNSALDLFATIPVIPYSSVSKVLSSISETSSGLQGSIAYSGWSTYYNSSYADYFNVTGRTFITTDISVSSSGNVTAKVILWYISEISEAHGNSIYGEYIINAAHT